MDHPKTFLLKKIVGYKENGLESLGQLNAKHVNDISSVMMDFAVQSITEIVERLNKGETVIFEGRSLSLIRRKRTKS